MFRSSDGLILCLAEVTVVSLIWQQCDAGFFVFDKNSVGICHLAGMKGYRTYQQR